MKTENLAIHDGYHQELTGNKKNKQMNPTFMRTTLVLVLCNPNGDQDIEVKAKHKGQQSCFIVANIDADLTESQGQKALILPET